MAHFEHDASGFHIQKKRSSLDRPFGIGSNGSSDGGRRSAVAELCQRGSYEYRSKCARQSQWRFDS